VRGVAVLASRVCADRWVRRLTPRLCSHGGVEMRDLSADGAVVMVPSPPGVLTRPPAGPLPALALALWTDEDTMRYQQKALGTLFAVRTCLLPLSSLSSSISSISSLQS
jgi:hypothetical protein